MYLAIRNPGVADYRGFTLIGASGTRNAGHEGTIGQFGSGSKFSVAYLLRNSVRPKIITGNLHMDFFTKPQMVSGQMFNQVCVKFSGTDTDGSSKTSTEDLGFVIEMGVADWTKPAMAVREFVSNAIDGAISNGGTYKDVELEIVSKPRAKRGFTCVFIPYTPEIEQVYLNLKTMFLHFGAEDCLSKKLLPKRRPENNEVLIYKKGVLVSLIKDAKSVFDYNFGDELTLDESRNAHEWDVKYAASKAIPNADPEDLAKILANITTDKDIWEGKLDNCYLSCNSYDSDEVKTKRSAAFKTAWKSVAGERGVATSGTADLNSFVEKKGYRPVSININWLKVLDSYGIDTESTVLSKTEREGKVISEATPQMIEAVDWVWNLLTAFDLTNGRDKPTVKGFMTVMDGGTQLWGYYEADTVYIHTDCGGKLLKKCALEEVVHHVTKAQDGSRDLQDFLFRLVVTMAD